MADLFGHRQTTCIEQGFHVPQLGADGPVVFCRECGTLIWSGETPITPFPPNERIWEMSRELAKEARNVR